MAFYKNTSDLIKCTLSECNQVDVFLIATYGNAAFYSIKSKNIFDITVESISGDTTASSMQPHFIVYRKKRFIELMVDEDEALKTDLSMFGLNDSDSIQKEEIKEEKKSNKLIDLLDDDNEFDIIHLSII
jgi:hypothetical protein